MEDVKLKPKHIQIQDMQNEIDRLERERDAYASALDLIVVKGSGIVQKGSFAHELVQIAKKAIAPSDH